MNILILGLSSLENLLGIGNYIPKEFSVEEYQRVLLDLEKDEDYDLIIINLFLLTYDQEEGDEIVKSLKNKKQFQNLLIWGIYQGEEIPDDFNCVNKIIDIDSFPQEYLSFSRYLVGKDTLILEEKKFFILFEVRVSRINRELWIEFETECREEFKIGNSVIDITNTLLHVPDPDSQNIIMKILIAKDQAEKFKEFLKTFWKEKGIQVNLMWK